MKIVFFCPSLTAPDFTARSPCLPPTDRRPGIYDAGRMFGYRFTILPATTTSATSPVHFSSSEGTDEFASRSKSPSSRTFSAREAFCCLMWTTTRMSIQFAAIISPPVIMTLVPAVPRLRHGHSLVLGVYWLFVCLDTRVSGSLNASTSSFTLTSFHQLAVCARLSLPSFEPCIRMRRPSPILDNEFLLLPRLCL